MSCAQSQRRVIVEDWAEVGRLERWVSTGGSIVLSEDIRHFLGTFSIVTPVGSDVLPESSR